MATKRLTRPEQAITIRFPQDLVAALRVLAEATERSFNGEVVWGLRQHVERGKGGAMRTYDRFRTIQAPDVTLGSDAVRCAVCGTVRPLRTAYRVNVERADIATQALDSTATLYACSAEHADMARGVL